MRRSSHGRKRRSRGRRHERQWFARRLLLEALQSRWLLAINLLDFGDAPAPYPTTLAEDGARHTASGPRRSARSALQEHPTPAQYLQSSFEPRLAAHRRMLHILLPIISISITAGADLSNGAGRLLPTCCLIGAPGEGFLLL